MVRESDGMICGKGMNPYKTVKSCKGLPHKEKRKGRGYYIQMEEPSSVDWLRASRRVHKDELGSRTIKKEGGWKTWLKEALSLIKRLLSLH